MPFQKKLLRKSCKHTAHRQLCNLCMLIAKTLIHGNRAASCTTERTHQEPMPREPQQLMQALRQRLQNQLQSLWLVHWHCSHHCHCPWNLEECRCPYMASSSSDPLRPWCPSSCQTTQACHLRCRRLRPPTRCFRISSRKMCNTLLAFGPCQHC